ncbi:MAG: hypothetical protein AABX91_02225 [Nanoarchaeota archaeon]
MKLKNMVLAAVPLLFGCKDITSPNSSPLSLKYYACPDEACATLGIELPQNGIRPLRFISMARYPGKQDYYWEITWTDTLINQTGQKIPISQKNWYEFGEQEDYSAVRFNLTNNSKVEYRLLVRVKEDSIVSRWTPK